MGYSLECVERWLWYSHATDLILNEGESFLFGVLAFSFFLFFVSFIEALLFFFFIFSFAYLSPSLIHLSRRKDPRLSSLFAKTERSLAKLLVVFLTDHNGIKNGPV